MTTIRAGLLVVIAAAVASVLWMAAAAHWRRSSDLPPVEGPEGWAIENVVHTQYEGAANVLRIAADHASTESLRFGAFRVGFAHRVVARNARIDVTVPGDPESAAKRIRVDLAQALTAMGDKSGEHGTLSGVSIDGFTLHATAADTGAWVEITAHRCETGVLNPERVRLEGDVRMRSADAELGFTRLVFDARSRHFVAADGGRVIAKPAGDPESPMDMANRAVAGVLPFEPRPES